MITTKQDKDMTDKLYQAMMLLHEYFMATEHEAIKEELKSLREKQCERVQLTKENPNYVPVREAMKRLGVTRQTVYRKINNGELLCKYLGDKPRVSIKSIEEFSKKKHLSNEPLINNELDEGDCLELHGEDIDE